MAESLRRLVNTGAFSVLQDKLELWLDSYHLNTCNDNVARCCEIVELNSRVQGQLFKILNLVSHEGGIYGGSEVLKSHLLPWLGQGLLASTGYWSDRALGILSESAVKDRQLNDVTDMYERSLVELENDLHITQNEADDLKQELTDTKIKLDSSKRSSTSEKIFADQEVRDLRHKLRMAEEELSLSRSKATMVGTYERQIRNLRDEVGILTGRKEILLKSPPSSAPASLEIEPYTRSLPRVNSPLSLDDVTQRVRQSNLIDRFNDMFASDRLDAMDTLRRFCDDHENNQRIVFTIMQEAFTAAKLAFASFKLRVRSNIVATHYGPETLEEAVQEYINRNVDLADIPTLISDVVRALNRNPRMYLPDGVSFTIVQPMIREACKLAWAMSALAHPLNVALATDAELYDDLKYRRSYDSEYTAPLVNHHIWPSLMQAGKVLVKGEACSRRGASLSPVPRSRSRSPSPLGRRARSASPMRSLTSSMRSRSRDRAMSPTISSRLKAHSPSPRRRKDISGRARPGLRASSPLRHSLTSSANLSSYGVVS